MPGPDSPSSPTAGADTSAGAGPVLPRGLGLPDFPWDTLSGARALAASHPGGLVDLSVGTPVDPTPQAIQRALQEHADSPGYPLVVGTPGARAAIHHWMQRRGMVAVPDAGVVPTTGSKEMVAWLPKILGAGPGDTVLFPDVAYPTYEVGATLAGATPVPVDQADPDSWPDATLVWLNSPSNPTGQVLTTEQLRAAVAWARAHGAVVIADECYAELPWSDQYRAPSATGAAEPGIEPSGTPSLLHPAVCDGDPTGSLVVYSLSKQSNMAGYRAGLLAGDPQLVAAVVEARKHGGMMVPTPVQAALAAALGDQTHVAQQYSRYAARREQLAAAVDSAGLQRDPDTEAGLYLWLSAPSDWDGWDDLPAEPGRSGGRTVYPNEGRRLVDWFARRGILVAPGDFYGSAGADHVRLALTATDERVAAAVARLGR